MPWRVAKLGYIFSPGDIQDPPDRLSRHADKEIRLAKRFQDRERLLRIWNMLENLTAYYQLSGVRLRRQFEKRARFKQRRYPTLDALLIGLRNTDAFQIAAADVPPPIMKSNGQISFATADLVGIANACLGRQRIEAT
ncbi:hypothetical protein A9K72_11355 [Mesorhizobium loti]|nr:hypothetical protein A9K72_11355 [Mesorhizobium loti]